MPKKQLFSAESGYRRNLAAVLGIMILFMMLTFFSYSTADRIFLPGKSMTTC